MNFLYSNPKKRSQVTLGLETKEKEWRHVLVKIVSAYACKETFGFKLVQAVHSIQELQFHAFKKIFTLRWKEKNLSVQSLNFSFYIWDMKLILWVSLIVYDN